MIINSEMAEFFDNFNIKKQKPVVSYFLSVTLLDSKNCCNKIGKSQPKK